MVDSVGASKYSYTTGGQLLTADGPFADSETVMDKMKRSSGLVLFACVLVAVISMLGGYRLACVKCDAKYNTSQKTNFLMGLSEMEHLRKGESAEVLSMLESRCYSCALVVLDMPANDMADAVIQSALNKLDSYRSNYAKADAEWSPTERRLTERLQARTR